MVSPLRGCDWPHVINPSCGRGLSLALICSHPPHHQGWLCKENADRRQPQATQAAGSWGAPPLPRDHGLLQAIGPPPEGLPPTPGKCRAGAGVHRVMTCLKARRLRPRKMKCEIVNVCLEGTVGITELPSAGVEGSHVGRPMSPKDAGRGGPSPGPAAGP